jgi:signal recognition particle receptor subunit beta
MVQINFAQKQVNAKIVFYGPGMSGKTTNLEVIHQRAPVPNKGELTSISTDGDRTLFFDFMPLDLGTVAGMRTCFQIYTVPGQVYYNSTRKLVLQGVDGVVFVADSSASMMEENLESMRNLEQNLNEYGKSITSIPVILQYNKRDLPDALPVEELNRILNPHGFPTFEAIANTGQGVFPTLKSLASKVLESIHGGQKSGAPASAPTPAAPTPSVPAPAAHAPTPLSAPAPAAVGVSQTAFHAQPGGASSSGSAARSLTQTAYQRGLQRPAAAAPVGNSALPPVPTFGQREALARTTIQAVPQHGRPAAPQAQPIPIQPQPQPQPQAAATAARGGLSMVQGGAPAGAIPGAHAGHAPRQAAPAPVGGPGADKRGGGLPTPRTLGAERPAAAARKPAAQPQAASLPPARSAASPRPSARSASAAAPAAAAPKKSKSLIYTSIFVLAALGAGGLVAKFVFSMF